MPDVITKYRGETVTLATSRAFATVRGIPPGFNAVDLHAPSATLENILVSFGPRIGKVYFCDASVPSWTDVTAAALDRNTATTFPLSVMQTADRLYVGTASRAEGVSINVTGTNGAGTATTAADYPLLGTWTALSITDGTFSTRTLAQDGLYTWTQPTTTWDYDKLVNVADESLAAPNTERLYRSRLRPSTALTDTSITVAGVVALSHDTINTATPPNEGQDDALIRSNNDTLPPFRFRLDMSRQGGVELVSTSITSAANLTWLYLE